MTYIIVLIWNGWADTEACLRSLAPVVSETVRVLVVDNGSSDGSPDQVRRRFPEVGLIENGLNAGFSAGNNVGIRHALERGATHVILLNNDTEVDPGFADALVAVAEGDPRIGLVTSKIYFFDRRDVLWFAGGTFSGRTGRTLHIGHGETDRGQYDGVSDIERPCFCSVLMTRAYLEKAGLLREDLFLYGEELDCMYLCRTAGFRSVLAPASKVWHKVGAGTGGTSNGNYLYYVVRNTLRLMDLHVPLPAPFRMLRTMLTMLVYVASLFTLNVRKGNGLRSILRGYGDYRKGITGPRIDPR